ncbi:MFS transporter [Novosphingobium sp. 11B]
MKDHYSERVPFPEHLHKPAASSEAGGSNLQTSSLPYPKPAYAWFVVVCLQLAYAVALIDRQILSLLVQPIRADLALSDTQFSLLVGFAFVLFYSTMGLFCGRLADTRNRRNMIIYGMILWSLATAACGLATNFTQLFITRMLVGVGEAVLSPAAYSMIADYFPKEKRSQAAAAYSMAISLGYGGALLAGGLIVAAVSEHQSIVVPVVGSLRGWQAVLMIVGAPGLIVAAMMLFIREPVRREVKKGEHKVGDAIAFVRSRAQILTLVILAFALNGLITNCVSTWTPATFMRTFGWSAAHIAAIQGLVVMTFGSAGIFAGGWVVARVGQHVSNAVVLTTARNALLLIPFFALLLGFAPMPWLRIVGIAGIAFLGGFPSGLAAVAIYHITPNQFRGQVTAMYLMTGTLVGFGVGVTLVAAITDYIFQNEHAIGISLGLVVATAGVVAAGLLHLALKRPDKDWD